MRPGRLCLMALALVAAPVGTLRAQSADDIPTAVLGLETQDVSPKLGDEISEYLRQNVSNNHDLRLVPGKDLVELKLVFACADESHTCMALAARSLKAEWLIYGSIKRTGDSSIVWLKLFDARQERVISWLTETLGREKSTGPALKPVVARWFAKLRGRSPEVGTLRVLSDVSDAVVSLDGVPAGAVTRERPFIFPEVAPGKHVISLHGATQGTASRTVTLAAGEVQEVRLSFAAAGAAAVTIVEATPGGDAVLAPGTAGDRESEQHARSLYRAGFWVTLTAGLVSAGAAVKYGLDIAQVNRDLDPYRRYTDHCTAGLCNSKGLPASPLTSQEQSAAARLVDKGNHAHDLQWVYIGVGGILGVASGYLLYKGYLDGDGEADGGGKPMAHRGLRIFPTAGASSGGVLAEVDF